MKLSRDESLGLTFLLAGLIALLLLTPGLLGDAEPALLRVLLGWGAAVAVVALILGGVALVFSGKMGWQVRWKAIAPGELFFFFLLILTHVGIQDPFAVALAGRGGGVVGWAGSEFLKLLFPLPFVWVVAVAGLLVSAWVFWRALPPDWLQVGAYWGRHLHPLALPARASVRCAPSRVQVWLRGLRETTLPSLPSGWLDAAATWLIKLLRNLRPAPDGIGSQAIEEPDRKKGRSSSRVPKRSLMPQKQPAKPAKARRRSPRRKARQSHLPPMDVLRADENNANDGADTRQRAQILKQTLAEFGVPVEVVSIKKGPAVTQFGLEPGEVVRELRSGEVRRRRVSVNKILRLSNDLALALAASPIRIEAPVPGRPYVGVEVPNAEKTLVSLRNVLESKAFAKSKSLLTTALGRDVSGDPVVVDLATMPHLLIAGATGSGKSVCINAIVCSLLMNNDPEMVHFLMVDPKMVELPAYNGIPHLIGQVITDTSQVTAALAWLTLQMDERYRIFADRGVRNIAEYNRKATRSRSLEPMPYIMLVIDELADLMLVAADDIERQICRLAQMSRATGIHLVLATQRPSVDVITGLIKANFPARIAFAVTSQIDSRVVLDTPGAERLLGRGDMLFMAPDSAKLTRVQGCFVSDEEIDRIVNFWKTSRPAEEAERPVVAPWVGLLDQMEEHDDLLEKALQLLRNQRRASTSWLQRHLHVGFPRAARLMEQLEEMGAVGPDEGGGRSREVLLQPDDE